VRRRGKDIALRRLAARPADQLAQLILRFGESSIPFAVRLDRINDQAGDGFLGGLGKPRDFGKGFLKQSVHWAIP